MRKQREVWLDALRAAAAFLVIVNHTNSDVFQASHPAQGTWWLSLLWYYVSKLAVPVFVLVSGACLLEKKDSFGKALKRFARIAGALLVFSYAYYLYDAWVYYGLWPRAADWGTFLSLVWRQQIADSFWYLYFYLGLMLMLPFLQRLCGAMTRRELGGFIALCLFFGGVWPLAAHYVPALALPGYFDIPLFTGYIGLFFAGHWLRTSAAPTKGQTRIAAAALVLMLTINLLLTYCEWLRVPVGSKYWFMDERTQPALFVMLGAIALAALVRGGLQKPVSARLTRACAELGACAFGVYLVQEWIIAQSEERLYLPLCQALPAFPAVIVWELAVFALALCAAWVMRRIPGLKSLL